ncbi:ATP-binding cassette domain-containing protein [Alkalihalobacillus sp. LMS6]|uniref:ATP-binding cassette domain-containing protein n=1 Tax=Alkalihalobacillus sp. LMS6 TaxID=2924034 RepID=UPI0020D04C5D|nr:ATP-binding cassette domain-containing protein [Alkalihalobacillus sp. LMS6]UTR07236.1 ATP-binding cassette domain-containing protein [Alkalihalobacillus sp. LMS6]
MLIHVENVHFAYRDHAVFKNVTTQFGAGKIYGLLGRNGVGKTTLLSLLIGARLATDGKVLFEGKPLYENERAMASMGMFYQRNDVDRETDNTKVEDLFKQTQLFRENFDLDYANELAQKFKINTLKRISKLSKGSEAAVQVIIGLASRLPVTIFDEVYLGMDAPSRTLFYSELLDEQERFPRTIIISTHLVSEMEHLFEEVLILKNGRFIVDEAYQSLIEKGHTITGDSEAIEEVMRGYGYKVIGEQTLGQTKAVSIYGEMDEQTRHQCAVKNLRISQISLQDLFIALTEEEGDEGETVN